MWYALKGIQVPTKATIRQTISHSHVLPHKLRSHTAAHSVVHRMLQKACRRLRAMDYFAGHLHVQVKFGFDHRWSEEHSVFPTQDSVTLARRLNALWELRPQEAPAPTKVSVVLSNLIHADAHTPSLFPQENQTRRVQLQQAMDQINKDYGNRSVYYADAIEAQRSQEAAPMRISFTHIPDLELEDDGF